MEKSTLYNMKIDEKGIGMIDGEDTFHAGLDDLLHCTSRISGRGGTKRWVWNQRESVGK